MPTYKHPGVYVEEIPSGAKPIEGVATSIAAFVGATEQGPVNQPTLVHNWDDYVRDFGPISSNEDWMALAVSAFYLNGGKDAYIGRLVSPPVVPSMAYATGANTGTDAVLVLSAVSPGSWETRCTSASKSQMPPM